MLLPQSVETPDPLSQALAPSAGPGAGASQQALIQQQREALTSAHEKEMTDAYANLDAKRAPLAEGLNKAADSLQAEIDKPVQQTPIPDNPAKHLDPKQLNEAASIWMTLGAFAGLLTRQPMTAALNNMTAAMKGAQEGDMEQFKNATAEWEKNFKTAMEKNKEMLAAKKEIINDKSLSLTSMEQRMKLVDLEYGSIPQRLETSFNNRLKSVDAQERMTLQAQQHADTLRQQAQSMIMAHQDRQESMQLRREMHVAAGNAGGAVEPLTPEALKLASELTAKGIPLPGGFSKAGMSRGNSILNEMAKSGASGGSVAEGRAEVKGDTASMAFQQKRFDAIEAGSKKIQNDIKTVDSYIKPGNADHAKIVNKLENTLRSAASDPTLAPYALAVKQVATEYERLMQGGTMSVAQLHSGAQEDATRILNENMTIAEVNAVIPVMLREIDNQRQSARDTLGEIKGRMTGKGTTGLQKNDSPPAEKNGKGWALHRNKKTGEMAYIGPAGEIEPVK